MNPTQQLPQPEQDVAVATPVPPTPGAEDVADFLGAFSPQPRADAQGGEFDGHGSQGWIADMFGGAEGAAHARPSAMQNGASLSTIGAAASVAGA